MDCRKIKSIIPRYVEHSVTEEEISMVEEHLCVCHDCRQYLSDFFDKKDTVSPETNSYHQDKDAKKLDTFVLSVLGIGIIMVFFSLWLFFKTR